MMRIATRIVLAFTLSLLLAGCYVAGNEISLIQVNDNDNTIERKGKLG